MAYIDFAYFKNEFCGCDIPEGEFPRLSVIASDVIDSIVTIAVTDENIDVVKKATAYEVEMLFLQGGVDAIIGMAANNSISTESLGAYSVSKTGDANKLVKTKGGIPISEMTLSLLRNAGLTCRWAYKRRHRHK